MKPLHGLPHTRIIRSSRNGHRYICFAGGRIYSFTTHEKDFLTNMAAMFGLLNGLFRMPYRFNRLAVSVTLLFMLLAGQLSWALPTGWQVESGEVSFEVNENTLNVTSASQSAIVNYQSFNVAGHETVNFFFLLPGGSILNRVLGGGPSQIAGAINSTGNVFLVNPAGINFTNGANLNVGGLVASTLDIQSNDFLNGNYVFSRNGDPAAITNDGSIQASRFAVLMASAIENRGQISAPDGTVQLAVGDQIRVAFGDNHAVDVTVDQALVEQVLNIQDAIVNGGEIEGQVVKLEAKLAEALYQRAVNNEGIIRSTRVIAEGGKIRLVAEGGENAIVENTGVIDGQGAEVVLSGDSVVQAGHLLSEGRDGQEGGKIGINARSQATLATGSVTSVKGNGENSDAGEIIVWSDGNTDFQQSATLDVSGGNISGDGGFAEVSAKHTVFFNGDAYGGATDGEAGHILIDPTIIRIQAAGPNGAGNVPYTDPDNGAGESIFAAASFSGFANVTLEATADIFIEAPWSLDGVTAGNALTLRAGDNIRINEAITTNGGSINLHANYEFATSPATGSGEIHMNNNAALNSNGGDILLEGYDLHLNTGSIQSGGGSITLNASDDIYLTTSLHSGGGNITLHGNHDPAGPLAPSGDGQIFVYAGGGVDSGGGDILMDGQDVEINATVNAGAGNITFRTYDDIILNEQLISTGGNITLEANQLLNGYGPDTNGDINIYLNGGISSGGGNIIMVGNDFHLNVGAIDSSGGDIAMYADDDIYITTAVNSAGGAINMHANYDISGPATPSGTGQVFVYAGGSVNSAGGNITMEGQDVEISGTVNADTGSITFRAFDDILIDGQLITSGGDVNLYGNQDLGGYAPSGNGDVDVGPNGSITTNGGNLLIEGWDSDINQTISTSGGTITIRTADDQNIAALISSGGGAINLQANYDITGSSVQSNNGFVNILAGGTVDSGNANILVQAADLDLDGAINAGNGQLTIRNVTNTAGNAVVLAHSLDDEPGGNDLVLSAPEMGRITANTVLIESNGGEDTIIAGDIDLNGVGPGKYNLSIVSSDDVISNGHMLNRGNYQFNITAADDILLNATGNNRGIALSNLTGNTTGTELTLTTDGLDSIIDIAGNVTSLGNLTLQTVNSDINVSGNINVDRHITLTTGSDASAGEFNLGGTFTVAPSGGRNLTIITGGGNLLESKLTQPLLQRQDITIRSYGADNPVNISGNISGRNVSIQTYDANSAINLGGNAIASGSLNIQTAASDIDIAGNVASNGSTTIHTGWTDNDATVNIGGTLTFTNNAAYNLTLRSGGGNLLQKLNQNVIANQVRLRSHGAGNDVVVNGNITGNEINIQADESNVQLNGNLTLTGNNQTMQIEAHEGGHTTITGSLNAAGTDQNFIISSRLGNLSVGDINHTGTGGEIRLVAGWSYNEDFRAFSDMTLGNVNILQRAGKLLKIKTGSDNVFANPFFDDLTGFSGLYLNRGSGFYTPNHVVTAVNGLYWASGTSVDLNQAAIDALLPNLSAPTVYLHTGHDASLTVSGNISMNNNFFKMQTTGANAALTLTGSITNTGGVELATDADNSPLNLFGNVTGQWLVLQTNEENAGAAYSPLNIGRPGVGQTGAVLTSTGGTITINTGNNPGTGTVINLNNGSLNATGGDIDLGHGAGNNRLAGSGNVGMTTNQDIDLFASEWLMDLYNYGALSTLTANGDVNLFGGFNINNRYGTVIMQADADTNGSGNLFYAGQFVPGDYLMLSPLPLPPAPPPPPPPYVLNTPQPPEPSLNPLPTVPVVTAQNQGPVNTRSEPGFIPVSHGEATDESGPRHYDISYGADYIILIDSVTKTEVAQVPVGQSPVASSFARNDRLAYVANAGDRSVSVVDLNELRVVNTIDVGTAPTNLYLSPSGRSLYVYGASERTIVTVDTARNRVLQSYQTEAGIQARHETEQESLPSTATARREQSQTLSRSINRLVDQYFASAAD